MSFGLRYGCPYDTSTMLQIFIKMLRISQRVAQKLSRNSKDLVVQGASIVAETGRNSQLCFEKLTKRNYTGVSSAIVILTICIFNQKYYTTSGDKHCKPSHLYIDLMFRMLVNIHFQW